MICRLSEIPICLGVLCVDCPQASTAQLRVQESPLQTPANGCGQANPTVHRSGYVEAIPVTQAPLPIPKPRYVWI